MFLASTTPPPPPQSFNPTLLQTGGLRLPPFPPRQHGNINMIDAPLSYMNEEQARHTKGYVFDQLDSFDLYDSFKFNLPDEYLTLDTEMPLLRYSVFASFALNQRNTTHP